MNKADISSDLTLDYEGTEAINTLCSNLSFAGRNIKKVVITSCDENEGKSFIAIQMMKNLADRGKKVVLVDADMRCSVLIAHYDIRLGGQKQGLAHFLSGQATLENCMYNTSIPNAYLIPVGTDVSNPLGLLNSGDFGKLLQALEETFDFVVVDAPPVGLVIDAAEIARCCDGVIFVVEYNRTHLRELKRAQAQIQATGTPVLGSVINKVTVNRLSTKKYYYYGHYYSNRSHYYTRAKKGQKKE